MWTLVFQTSNKRITSIVFREDGQYDRQFIWCIVGKALIY